MHGHMDVQVHFYLSFTTTMQLFSNYL